MSNLGNSGDGEGDTLHGVDGRRGHFEGHDVERKPLNFLNARNDEGPASDDDQRLLVEASGHDDGLVRASGHETHATHCWQSFGSLFSQHCSKCSPTVHLRSRFFCSSQSHENAKLNTKVFESSPQKNLGGSRFKETRQILILSHRFAVELVAVGQMNTTKLQLEIISSLVFVGFAAAAAAAAAQS